MGLEGYIKRRKGEKLIEIEGKIELSSTLRKLRSGDQYVLAKFLSHLNREDFLLSLSFEYPDSEKTRS